MRRLYLFVFALCLALSACDAFEDSLSFVCEGTTENRTLDNNEVVSSESSQTRKFIVFRNRKIGNNECLNWTKSSIQCQSVDQSHSLSEANRAYMLTLDRTSGEVNETSDTLNGYSVFTGKCVPYKGPKL